MRTSFVASGAFALSLAASAALFPLSASAAGAFARTLMAGMTGADVRELQIVLNSDPDTRVAASGPGSYGQESSYFGSLTRDAVMRFQAKHSQEILVPSGLSAPTGVVGPATRSILDGLAQSPTPASPIATSAQPSPAATSSRPNAAAAGNPNNQKNLDRFIGTVEKVAKEKGRSDAEIATIASLVRKGAATSTDLRATFLGKVKKDLADSLPKAHGNLITQAFDDAAKALLAAVTPETAEAAYLLSFGGALDYAYPCVCSNSWLIGVTPLPPTYVELLSYVTGSQAYLSYNLPFGAELLGKYSAGTGVCLEPAAYSCYEIPSEGLISPIVGSSPL